MGFWFLKIFTKFPRNLLYLSNILNKIKIFFLILILDLEIKFFNFNNSIEKDLSIILLKSNKIIIFIQKNE
jgi:hypothetical protein